MTLPHQSVYITKVLMAIQSLDSRYSEGFFKIYFPVVQWLLTFPNFTALNSLELLGEGPTRSPFTADILPKEHFLVSTHGNALTSLETGWEMVDRNVVAETLSNP